MALPPALIVSKAQIHLLAKWRMLFFNEATGQCGQVVQGPEEETSPLMPSQSGHLAPPSVSLILSLTWEMVKSHCSRSSNGYQYGKWVSRPGKEAGCF